MDTSARKYELEFFFENIELFNIVIIAVGNV